MKLYKHQQDAVDEIFFEVDAYGEKNIVLEAPTSFGKSLVIAELCNKFSKENIVILVNIEPLIDQIAEHLKLVNVDYSILKAGREDEFDANHRVHIVMSQTMYSRIDSVNIKADIVIQDERHREFDTERTKKILDILCPKSVIGLTATPYDNNGYCLEDASIIRTIDIPELEKNGYVTPVKYYVPKWVSQLNLDELRMSGSDYSGSAIDELMNTEDKLDLIVKSMDSMNAKEKKTLVFCNSIEQCDIVTEKLLENGYLAGAIHSKKTKEHNNSVLNAFKGICEYETNLFDELGLNEIKCLVSVSKLNIGFSVSDIQLGVFLRPTKVRSLYIQSVGRIIRPFEGKEYAEFLDLAGAVAEHGFHYELYEPPKVGDKKALAEAKDKAEASAMFGLLNEEPTEITRQQIEVHVQEIKKKEAEAISGSKELSFEELNTIYERATDVEPIVSVAFKIHSMKNGSKINSSTIEWICDKWNSVIDENQEYKRRWIKALKTRAKNIVRENKKLASLYYFIDFLEEKKLENFY